MITAPHITLKRVSWRENQPYLIFYCSHICRGIMGRWGRELRQGSPKKPETKCFRRLALESIRNCFWTLLKTSTTRNRVFLVYNQIVAEVYNWCNILSFSSTSETDEKCYWTDDCFVPSFTFSLECIGVISIALDLTLCFMNFIFFEYST